MIVWLAQVTATEPVPGRVLLPISQDHDTRPEASTSLGPSPCAVLFRPDGTVYEMEHCQLGGAWTVTDALCVGAVPWTAMNRSPTAVSDGWVSVAAGPAGVATGALIGVRFGVVGGR